MNASMPVQAQRDTIFVEDALILSHTEHAGDQFVMRVSAPKCARMAEPGQFAHLQCDPQRAMRRPISIMRVSTTDGWVDFLYKRVGEGTALLANREAGENINMLGPIGKGFTISSARPLLIGGGVGMPPMIFAAERLRSKDCSAFVILGSEAPFPFSPRPSQLLVNGVQNSMPDGVIAAMPLLDDWGIPSRLASLQGYAGCHHGYVTDLARIWLDALDQQQRSEVSLHACGPHPMLQAVVSVARDYDLPVQVSLEEFMACAVGGCAGCVVEVTTENGTAMKRVCVDGPVFEGKSVRF
jgi:dihydroorotate dehydrogenase electron transfer subunit